jgi:hypothetical protein
LQCLESDFNTEVEDDSVVTEVSSAIQEIYRQCAAGDTTKAQAIIDAPPVGTKPKPAGEDKPAEPKAPKRVVDEDGWETIVPKGRRGAAAASATVSAGAGTAGPSRSAPSSAATGPAQDDDEGDEDDGDDDDDDDGSGEDVDGDEAMR